MTDNRQILLDLVLSLEWANGKSDQDGRRVTACPACGGINPKDRLAAHFVQEARGHRSDCRLDFVVNRVVLGG